VIGKRWKDHSACGSGSEKAGRMRWDDFSQRFEGIGLKWLLLVCDTQCPPWKRIFLSSIRHSNESAFYACFTKSVVPSFWTASQFSFHLIICFVLAIVLGLLFLYCITIKFTNWSVRLRLRIVQKLSLFILQVRQFETITNDYHSEFATPIGVFWVDYPDRTTFT
jgi:hypothetical protein